MTVADLPVAPPVPPMLATLARELPRRDHCYEPKWDGFRCVAFRHGDDVVLQSRHGRPLTRYFPELVEAVLAVGAPAFVLDGEILATGPGGPDFSALMLRLHPSPSRVERLRRETPATFMAFDLLAEDGRDRRADPLVERRAALEGLVGQGASPNLVLTPVTGAVEAADAWLEQFSGAGIDGVVAKAAGAPYEAGRRSAAWVKVKRERTADCVVGGFRWVEGGAPAVASLLLGLYDGEGRLRHTGVASSFPAGRRRQLVEELDPYVAPLEGHPWEHGFALERGPTGRLKGAAGSWNPATMALDWVPLRPERVCEVAYAQVDLATGRWRHPVRFCRWRPDRDPASCTLDQFLERQPA